MTDNLNPDGTIRKSDPLDAGVPMMPAPEGWVHQGPEDALDPNPTRGDYRGRLGETVHMTGHAERKNRLDQNPTITMVHQNPHAETIVDVGGPLDEADPDYEAKKAARLGRNRS